MLKLYSIFHLNLNYSSIETTQWEEVIKRCYWPLLRLVEEQNILIGIEVNGYTLEKINEIDPAWITKIKDLIKNKKCEFIGSGYAQLIGPLVPEKVNNWNQKLGQVVYKELLGTKPEMALVNEMAYSSGIIEHYIERNYKAIIMEWNNPKRYHPEWENEWRYFPQIAVGKLKREIPLVWTDSIAFQKFQRYIHGEYELDEYINYLESCVNKDEVRYFPLYANDVEIFNFRPGRYHTEMNLGEADEWERMKILYAYLQGESMFDIISPSEVLDGLKSKCAGNHISLESPEQPIPVKKQEKYNINRWALTGRNDLRINTRCFAVFNAFLNSDSPAPADNDWKTLCYLWSSDFRTHITENKWTEFKRHLDEFYNEWVGKACYRKKEKRNNNKDKLDAFVEETEKFVTVRTRLIECKLNKQRGLSIKECSMKDVSSKPLFGTLPHGYYDDISLGADFYSGHTIIEKPGDHKITDLHHCVPEIEKVNGRGIYVKTVLFNKGVEFEKKYFFSQDAPYFEMFISIKAPSRFLSIIHPSHFTFIPASFKKSSLFYSTHNGGLETEEFRIGNNTIHHSQNLSPLISSKHGLGATEGIVIISDQEKQVSIYHDQTVSALIPSVQFSSMAGNDYFLRLSYSAQEIDETFREDAERQNLELKLRISAARNN